MNRSKKIMPQGRLTHFQRHRASLGLASEIIQQKERWVNV